MLEWPVRVPREGGYFLTDELLIPVDSLKRSDPPGNSSRQPGLLGRLTLGCFVKICLTDCDFWAEVTSIHGAQIHATVRHLVDQDGATSNNAAQWLGRAVTLTEADIADTGCDTLCWC